MFCMENQSYTLLHFFFLENLFHYLVSLKEDVTSQFQHCAARCKTFCREKSLIYLTM